MTSFPLLTLLGQRIKSYRKALTPPLTQTNLAGLANTTQRIIYQLETGNYPNPGLNLIVRIAGALETTAAALLLQENTKESP